MKWGAKHDAGRGRWAVLDRQFDLTRTATGEKYLTRWWIVDTPLGGLALHRMTAPDARDAVHTHPFSFVAFPIVGGYIEERLDSNTMHRTWRAVSTKRALRRAPLNAVRFGRNVVRAGLDAHTITELLRVPTYTLLLVGPVRGTWGFLEPAHDQAEEKLLAQKVNEYLDDGRIVERRIRLTIDEGRPGFGPARWRWTRHDRFDSGHYAPEKGRTR